MTLATHLRGGRSALKPLLARPYLSIAIAFGVASYFVAGAWLGRPTTQALIGWNGGVALFLVLIFLFMRGAGIDRIKRKAIDHDEGGSLILVLAVLAAIASVGAMAAELTIAKGDPGESLRVALAVATVVLSWLFVQIVFAVHYAHVYYIEEESGQPRGGLTFGGGEEPDYWDFVHFAIVLGTAAQTADVSFSSRRMRRLGTLHTLVAFGFNTAILATMINLAAALF